MYLCIVDRYLCIIYSSITFCMFINLSQKYLAFIPNNPFWECNFSMNSHIRLLVGWSVILSWFPKKAGSTCLFQSTSQKVSFSHFFIEIMFNFFSWKSNFLWTLMYLRLLVCTKKAGKLHFHRSYKSTCFFQSKIHS